MGPTALLLLRRKACWGFFRPKNPTDSARFEPANLGTKGQHATPRPPKPLYIYTHTYIHKAVSNFFFLLNLKCLEFSKNFHYWGYWKNKKVFIFILLLKNNTFVIVSTHHFYCNLCKKKYVAVTQKMYQTATFDLLRAVLRDFRLPH